MSQIYRNFFSTGPVTILPVPILGFFGPKNPFGFFMGCPDILGGIRQYGGKGGIFSSLYNEKLVLFAINEYIIFKSNAFRVLTLYKFYGLDA
ncbi:hypothetical protein [Sinomicrobium sp. M5D2P17]